MNVDHDNELTGAVIGAAIHVHRCLGPELKEPAYEEALARRLSSQGIKNRCQVPIPLYKDVRLNCGFRLDVLVEERLPLELKSVATLLPVHDAQLLTYLRVTEFPLGLLMNFNVALLKEGIRRKVHTKKWSAAQSEDVAPAIDPKFDPLSAGIVDAAVEVHRHVGPGLLRSAYEECLCHELFLRGQSFERERQVPLRLDGELLSSVAELPLLVDDIPVFCLSVSDIAPIHTATALARMRQGRWKQSRILNFNLETISAGIKRVVL